MISFFVNFHLSGRHDLNVRPHDPQPCALPTELRPVRTLVFYHLLCKNGRRRFVMAQDQKLQAIRLAMETIEKQYGKGSIMKLGEKAHIRDAIDVISSGILPLDLALGVGGVPRGRIVEIYGPEASGKTTVCLSIVAEAQKNGGVAAFIDAEHALDPQWAEVLGVKLDDLLISQPDTGEQALEIAESLIRSGGVDVLVIDSV